MRFAGLTIALLLTCFGTVGHTSAQAGAPEATRAVRIEERLGVQVPRELVFTTPDGVPVRFGDYTRGDMPVLLVFAYARCRALCNVVLKSAGELMRSMVELSPGRDYRPLLVGLDAKQTLEAAQRHQKLLLERTGLAGEPQRFPYLLGRNAQVAALADAVGFRYAWDERSRQYAHPAALIVLDRSGRVFRYLHALGTTPEALASALRAADTASKGLSVSSAASLQGELLRCFRFDPALRRHRETIAAYFRVGGAMVFGALLSLVVGLFVRERRGRT